MTSIKQFVSVHQNGLKKFLKFLPICIFGFIELFLKNRFFFIFIVLFFVVALFLEHRRYFFLIITTTLIFITLNTLAFDNLVSFKNVDLPFYQHPKQALINLFSPNSGEEVYPSQVQTMVSLLHSYNIETYNLSDHFMDDVETQQRIVGAAWPIKLEKTSPYLFIGNDEIQNFQGCAIIEQKEYVTLVNCR